MRVHEILSEKHNFKRIIRNPEWAYENPEEIANMLKKRCGQFLTESDGRMMYRGLRERGSEMFDEDDVVILAAPQPNRQENGNSVEIRLHDLASLKMGNVANRENSFFCSGDDYVAEGYGRLYVVFPLDGFDFTWSTEVADFQNMVDNFESYSYVFDDMEDEEVSELTDDDKIHIMSDVLTDDYVREITDEHLASALDSGHEIMVRGKCFFVQASAMRRVEPYL